MSTNLKGKDHELLMAIEFSSFQILNMRKPEEEISRDGLPFGNVHSFFYSFVYIFVYSFVYSFVYRFVYSFVYSFIYLFDGVYCKLKLAAVKLRPISSIRTFNFQTFSRSGLYHKHCKKSRRKSLYPCVDAAD